MRFTAKILTITLISFVAISGSPAQAAQANITGALSNFDTFNDTGKDAHGFEIELDGVTSADVQYFFGAPYNRYGTPSVTEFNSNGVSGVKVRWMSGFDAVKGYQDTTAQAPTSATPTMGHDCYLGGPAGATQQIYDASGCEHFGIGTVGNPTNVVYHWLIDDGSSAGNLVTADSPVSIPAPVWSTNGANVAAAVPAPVQVPVPALPAKPECSLWGPAQWMKVYKTESHAPAQLGALLTDNPNVPQEPAEVETEWKFVQAAPTCSDDGAPLDVQPENEVVNDAPVGAGSESVTRRYEFYDYTGAYDDTDGGNHEAMPLCDSDPYRQSCSSAPMADPNSDLGAYKGAQMVAANLGLAGVQTPNLAVTMSGDGTGLVSDGNGIGCGDLCSGNFAMGTQVTLTATPDNGSHVAGWSVPSCGISTHCTVTMNADTVVNVEFTTAEVSAPTITSISPTSADAGAVVTIRGTNFTSDSTVAFNGVDAVVKTVTATALTAVVPCAATTGYVSLQTSSGSATGPRLTRTVVKPRVTSVTPTTTVAGGKVTVKGTALYCVNRATLAGVDASVTPGTTTQFTFNVPVGATTGTVSAYTPAGSYASTTKITVIKPASITSFTPTHAYAGATVTLTGTGFTGVSKVTFNGVSATSFKVVNDTTVTAVTSAAATSGLIAVTNLAGISRSVTNFTIDIPAPKITSVSPLSVKVGSAVTLKGTNFVGVTSVKIGTKVIPATVVSSTTIVFGVPVGTATGSVTVTTNSGTATGARVTVLAGTYPAKFTSFSSNTMPEGDWFTVNGTNFGAVTSIRLAGYTCNFKVLSATSISVQVPSGSSTGAMTITTPAGSILTSVLTVAG